MKDTYCADRRRTAAHTIEVRDDLIEEAQTLDASVVDAFLRVEVREVWNGGKHDSDLVVRLAVQFLEHNSPETLTKALEPHFNDDELQSTEAPPDC